MQSLDQTDFRNGATTDAMTWETTVQLGDTLQLATSATLGRTRQGDLDRQNIAVSSGGLLNSAFQVAATKQGVLGRTDILRVSLAQPLHVETGQIDINTTEVVDRLTGELGTVVQTVDLRNGPRQFVAEVNYGHSMLDGQASLNLFSRTMLNEAALTANQPAFLAGASFNLAF